MCYRNLTDVEVQMLQKNQCWTKNWSHIQVKDGFDPAKIYNVEFYGDIKLGSFDHEVSVNGIMKDCCIKNSSLHNCEIGDNAYINNVTNISNYIIENCVVIEDVGNILVSKPGTFGNGIEIDVLNEGGGRELPIFEELNAQLAYILVTYQHDQELIGSIKKMIADFVKTKKSHFGRIGKQAKIQQVKRIENVNIQAFTKIFSSGIVKNGTIMSTIDNHSEIRNARLVKNFIMQEGSRIENDAQVENCFVGQAVTIGKQYSAENSAFFANSECYHGEACSLFAGPYTVTHHKSSLLIAGLFSFYNAGSGSNQSNHMYKLGPVHQGILERGCKTGSFSYLLWPSRVGAFSAVMGKHYNHFDVSDFPFSYIEEHDGESVLSPAMNLITVGTLRDSQKWPKRDKRTGVVKRDFINFDFLSPYIISKVIKAQEKIADLYENANKNLEYVTLEGVKIKRLLLRTAKKYYKIPIRIFIGDQIVRYIEKNNLHKKDDFFAHAFDKKMSVEEQWIDMLGLIAPKQQIESLTKHIKSNELQSLEQIVSQLSGIHEKYDEYAWQWTVDLIEKQHGKKAVDLTTDDFGKIIEKWKSDKIKLNNMILRDADKEFDVNAIKGYGIDGDASIKQLDFDNVHGTKESNSFIKGLLEENKQIEETADKITVFFR